MIFKTTSYKKYLNIHFIYNVDVRELNIREFTFTLTLLK